MTSPAVLGPLSSLHEMTTQLLLSIPREEAGHQYHPELGSLAWHLGRAVYLEAHWLRERLAGDDDLTGRVSHLFTPGAMPLAEQCASLPPVDHLLNWAAEIRDEHLTRLANPRLLPADPLIQGDRLQWYLVQEQAREYERMLMVLCQRQLRMVANAFRAGEPLDAALPRVDTGTVEQGHYRVGARDEPGAYDNELPSQAVKLASFRIQQRPVTNAEYLMFMEQDGYGTPDWWSDEGREWLGRHGTRHPEYWRRDPGGRWFGVGVNGPADLPPQEPVTGLNHHEARAFAAWAAATVPGMAGAVLQHEYQWEVAARTGALREHGRAQEWCANPFHAYAEFEPFPDPQTSQADFDEHHFSLRSASLHTQPVLRRPSLRDRRLAHQGFGFSGARLVLPPEG